MRAIRNKNGRFVKGNLPWNTGTKGKIVAWNKGKSVHLNPKFEWKKGDTAGNKNPFYGKKHTKETIEKIKKARAKQGSNVWNKGKHGLQSLEKHPNWRGGISFEPYSVDWNQTLKRSIRERDKYTCQNCGIQQGDKAFHIHHINGDKKNCDPKNLITLCHGCHIKHHWKLWKKY